MAQRCSACLEQIAHLGTVVLWDDDVSDQFMPNLLFEDRAAEIAAAMKVLADRGISDAHWPMACADVLCALVRADDSAIARHTPGGARVDGRAARRLFGIRGTTYLGGELLPPSGIWFRADEGAKAKSVVRVTVFTEPGQALSLLLFFDRTTTPEERTRTRMLLEIAEPVLASSAAYRSQLARRLIKPDGRAVTTPALAGEDAVRLRDRYGLTLREIEVTRLLLRGESNREIADRLNISEHTARHHTERVLGKLGVRSRAAIPRAVSPLRSSGPFRGT
jgi:DNA-binding CsgD family transcriptional regulator